MSDKDWLQNLKPGDKVIESDRDEYSWGVRDVSRTLKRQIVLKGFDGGESYIRYSIADGYEYGNQYSRKHLQPYTEENLARLELQSSERKRRSDTLRLLDKIVFRHLATEQLERIVAIANEGREVT